VTAIFGSTESDLTRPTPAELARTAIACASVGCVTTYPRGRPGRPLSTQVALEPDVEGAPLLRVSCDSPAASQLVARPLATLAVAPSHGPAVRVHGSAHRLSAQPGLLRYRLDVIAVRVAMPQWRSVSLTDYRAAVPDPLRHDAPDVLLHLARHHCPQLAACLRALGHKTQWAEPRALDCRGLDVVSITEDGVELVRLPFPKRVTCLRELSTGMAAPLLCRCQRNLDRKSKE
jgi:hypothetical protein